MPRIRTASPTVFVALLVCSQGFAAPPQKESRAIRGLKLGLSSSSLPERGRGGFSRPGLSVGVFGRYHGLEVEMLSTREGAHSLLETAILFPILAREEGDVRQGLHLGLSSGMGLGSDRHTLFDYNLALVLAARVEVGRWSFETRYRHGLLDYGWTRLPDIDLVLASLFARLAPLAPRSGKTAGSPRIAPSAHALPPGRARSARPESRSVTFLLRIPF